MPVSYQVFRGQIYAVGMKPDGDTLTFRPHNPSAVAALPDSEGNAGTAAFDADKNNAVSVRLQGVDALETHYQPAVGDNKPAGATAPVGVSKPSAGNHHQRLDLSHAAAHALLGMLGVTVTEADWHSWGYLRRVTVGARVVEEKFKEAVEAVVVAESVDRNGRLLGWVFPGSVALAEGATLTEADLLGLLKQSCNAQLLSQGHAYPYFYFTLSTALRSKLSIATSTAQRYRRGLWAQSTPSGSLAIPTVSALNDTVILLPYLFRKLLRSWRLRALATYWAGGDVSAAALETLDVGALFESGDPYLYTVSDRQFVRLSQVVTASGGTLTLTRKPQDLVFLE